MTPLPDLGPLYRRLRAKLIVYLEGRGCTDPEEVADEALYRAFVDPGVEGKPVENIEAFTFGVAKNVLHEWIRRNRRLVQMPEHPPEAGAPPPDTDAIAVRAAMDTLRPEDRELLVDFYEEGRTAEELAPQYHLTASGIRVRIHHLKKALRRILRRRPSAGGLS